MFILYVLDAMHRYVILAHRHYGFMVIHYYIVLRNLTGCSKDFMYQGVPVIQR